MRAFPAVFLLASLLLISCVSTQGARPEAGAPASSDKDIPVLTLNDSTEGAGIQSPAEGRLLGSKAGPDGLYSATIACKIDYFWKDAAASVAYELVFGGLSSVSPDLGAVKVGAEIGKASAKPYVTARCAALDPFLIRMSPAPVFSEGYWYFAPNWLLPDRTQWLTFRRVNSFKAAVEDFYRRWRDEGAGHGDATIHYFPNLDRIEAPIELASLPTPAEANSALAFTEDYFYKKKGVYSLESRIDLPGDYDAILYWQDGFDKYLADEYKLGSKLWIYCSIFTLDHANKRIIVCVRDFSLKPNDETIKLAMAKAKKK
jgi:hypothetical protein